ncbi:DUF1801 domain-containing protein [Compostimonas suwonensis]|nr:DUF1801 domain-containing protein [Compostimonas suwonensis]
MDAADDVDEGAEGRAETGVPAEVAAYLDGLPEGRRSVIRPVFETVREAMPEGYELVLAWGMPGWVVPLTTFPRTYNGQPLAYVSLADQKNYNSLYLMGLYSDGPEDRAFREAWEATGLALDMGKSCLRFRALGDVDLPLIARTVASMPVPRFLEVYERARG